MALTQKQRADIVKLVERMKADKDGGHIDLDLCERVNFGIDWKHSISNCWFEFYAGFGEKDFSGDRDADLEIMVEGADDYIRTYSSIVKLLTESGLEQTYHKTLDEERDWVQEWLEGCDHFVLKSNGER